MEEIIAGRVGAGYVDINKRIQEDTAIVYAILFVVWWNWEWGHAHKLHLRLSNVMLDVEQI